MPVWVEPQDGSGRILFFDVTDGENHDHVNVVTEHPVEEGANITDHVRPELDTISLTGFISNTPLLSSSFRGDFKPLQLDIKTHEPPLGPTPGQLTRAAVNAVEGLLAGPPESVANVLQFDEEFDEVRNTYEHLQQIRLDGVQCRVVTSVREYENMLIVRLGTLKGALDGGGGMFQVDFQEIRLVDTDVVVAPEPSEPRGGARKRRGSKPAAPTADDVEKRSSLAHQLASAAGVF